MKRLFRAFLVVVFAATMAVSVGAGQADAAPAECVSTPPPPVLEGQVTGNLEIDQISGLVESRPNPGVYWTVSDKGGSGGKNEIKALVNDAGTFLVVAEVLLESSPGVPQPLVDLEAMSYGPGPTAGETNLYVGDIGDTKTGDPAAERSSISLFRFPEPDLSGATPAAPLVFTLDGSTGDFQELQFSYPADSAGITSRNAESLIVDTDRVFIFQKYKKRPTNDVTDTYLYSALLPAGPTGTPVLLDQIGSPLVSGMRSLTGADLSADGTRVAVRNRASVRLWERDAGQTLLDMFAAAPEGECSGPVNTHSNLGGAKQAWESIGFSPTGNSYVTVEDVNIAQRSAEFYRTEFDETIGDGYVVGAVAPPAGSSVWTLTAEVPVDAGITKVSWWVDDAYQVRDPSGPIFAKPWDSIDQTDGDHLLYFKAFAGSTLIFQSDSIVLTIDNSTVGAGFSVGAIEPAFGASVWTLTADVAGDAGVTKVSGWVDGAFQRSDANAPFSKPWDSIDQTDGDHDLYFKAFVGSSLLYQSDPITISIDNSSVGAGFSVGAIPPDPGSTKWTLTADVPVEAGITKVSWWVDGVFKRADSVGPVFSKKWDSVGETDGDHELYFKAYAGSTLLHQSDPIIITIDNAG